MEETIRKQMLKTGETEFLITDLKINTTEFFIPVKTLNNIRRNALEKLKSEYKTSVKRDVCERVLKYPQYPYKELDYSYNVLNSKAEDFYRQCGSDVCEHAAESGISLKQKTLMTTKHCIKYTLGLCPKYFKVSGNSADYYLVDEKRVKYALKFDCKNCEMRIEKI